MTAPEIKKEMQKVKRMIKRIRRILDTCGKESISIDGFKMTVRGTCNSIWLETPDLEKKVDWFLDVLERADNPTRDENKGYL